MDKAADSGSADVGSIPVRDAKYAADAAMNNEHGIMNN